MTGNDAPESAMGGKYAAVIRSYGFSCLGSTMCLICMRDWTFNVIND